jgi:hypothetical protein
MEGGPTSLATRLDRSYHPIMAKTVAELDTTGVVQVLDEPYTRPAVVIRSGQKGAARKVKFGDVVVTARLPTKDQVRHNVALSTEALQRIKSKISRPGVRIHEKKNVPLFFADPEHPGMFIRKLNGKRDKGVLENGLFKITE